MRPRDPKELAVIKAAYPRHGMKYSRDENGRQTLDYGEGDE